MNTSQNTLYSCLLQIYDICRIHSVLVAKCLQSSAWRLNSSSIHFRIICKKVRKARRPTCGFYEAWVGIICDEGDRQLSEVEFEGPSDDVDVLVSTRGNISFFSICGGKPNQSVTFREKKTPGLWWKMKYLSSKILSGGLYWDFIDAKRWLLFFLSGFASRTPKTKVHQSGHRLFRQPVQCLCYWRTVLCSTRIKRGSQKNYRGRHSPLSNASLTSSISSLKPDILYKPSDWRPDKLERHHH